MVRNRASFRRIRDRQRAQSLSVLVVVVGLVFTAHPAVAQSGANDPLVPGSRVRVSSVSSKVVLIGRLVAVSGDTLAVLPSGLGFPETVRLDDRTKVDVSIAHHNYLGGGIVAGALLGGSVGGMIVLMEEASTSWIAALGGRQETSKAPIGYGALIGGALGGLIGSSIDIDTWVPVRVPARVSLGTARDGELRLALSLR